MENGHKTSAQLYREKRTVAWADRVEAQSRRAVRAQSALDARTLKDAVRKIKETVLEAQAAGLQDALSAELKARGYGQ